MESIPLLGTSIWLIVKIFFLVALVIYLIFALVVIKQVNIMTDTLDLSFEVPVKILAFLHFLFALAVLIIAFLIL